MLDDQHGRRDVVVGDCAGRLPAGGDAGGRGAVRTERLRVADVRALVDRVGGVRVERDRDTGARARERAGGRVVRSHAHREVGRRLVAAVVVDHRLDDRQARLLVVVCDRAVGMAAGRQAAAAAGRADRLRVAGVGALVDRVVGVGVERHGRAGLIARERAVGRVGAGFVLQFAVDQDLHRRDAAERDDGIDHGRRHRLDLVERLVVGAAAEIRFDTEFLHRQRRELCQPAFELAIEVAAGVALAARVRTARAVRRQLLVNGPRNRLIGRGPVAVAAAEHPVAHFRERILRQVAAKPFDELRGVVGRRAIVRRAENQDAALLGQLADEIIEGCQFCRKAIDLGEIGDPGCEFLGGTEVRSIKHQQRRIVPRARSRARRRRGCRCSGRRCSPAGVGAAILFGSRPHLDLEAIRLDGQRFLQHHLIAVVINQLETLQDHADRERRLMHRKAAPDAGALTVAERLPGIDGPRGLSLAAEVFRIERVRVRSPHRRVAMQCQRKHQNKHVLLELVFATDGLVLQRRDAIGGRWRPQPQGFLQNLRDVGELCHLLISRPGIDIGPEHPVDFLIGFPENLGMLQQRIERAGQQAAGRFVPCNQERVDLVADVDVIEVLAGGAVDARHHGSEHVLLVRGGFGILAALGDDLVDHLVHEGDVTCEVAVAVAQPQPFERKAAGQHDGLERTHQRLDERVIIFSIKRVKTVIESTQPDGVERQCCHVVNDVDLLISIQAFPLLDQLLGDINHARVVGLHGAVAERLQQDVVRLAPVRLIGIGGEQPIAADGTDAAQRTAHRLVETLLVRELVDQIMAGNDDERRAHHV